jgi:hypothetical protein
MTVTTRNLDWLSGWLEGEGCFTLAKPKTHCKYVQPILAVNTTDIDVAAKAAVLFGTGFRAMRRAKPHHKLPYEVRLTGSKAVGWMMTVYGLMGHRRKKRIREVVAAWRANPAPKKIHPSACHPERPSLSLGKCGACYQRDRWRMKHWGHL